MQKWNSVKAESLAKHYEFWELKKDISLVFQAVGGVGPIDLIGILDGKTRYFDVKN